MDDVFDYQKDHPELIKVCLNCHYKDCHGKCKEWNAKKRELQEAGEIRHIERGERRLKSTKYDENRALFKLDGEWYTVRALSIKTGISDQALYYRLMQTHGDVKLAIDDAYFSRGASNARKAKKYTANGETHTATEWAEILGIPRKRLYDRIRTGHTIEEAIAMGERCKKGRPQKIKEGNA